MTDKEYADEIRNKVRELNELLHQAGGRELEVKLFIAEPKPKAGEQSEVKATIKRVTTEEF